MGFKFELLDHDAAILVLSLPMKSRKKLVREVFDTFATHFGLAYDLTDISTKWQLSLIHI